VAAPSVDSILRAGLERRAFEIDRSETGRTFSRPAAGDIDTAHTPPTVIGRAPDPAFPVALLRSGLREGRVVVRFMVNERGRVDVASIIVEQSDHELFTAAVRDILPRFRFEPARTLGRESNPISAWVSVPFRFTTKK
jgi:TonB family protein